jgi:general secretion pathway protein M
VKELLAKLSESERRTLVLASVVLVLLLFYALVWDPVMSATGRMQARVDQQRESLAWMQGAASEAQALMRLRSGAAQATDRGGQSLLAIVDQTARRDKLGPALKRIEPRGQDEVRVRLEDAVFDDMMRWLAALQQRYGVTIDSVAIDRQPSPGRVTVNLTLKDAAA